MTFTFESLVVVNLARRVGPWSLIPLEDGLYALVDADVLLFGLHHPNPLLPHLVNYTEYVDYVAVPQRQGQQYPVQGYERTGSTDSSTATDAIKN